MVYDVLGWEYFIFGYMIIIVNEDCKKLSKRDINMI